MKPKHTPGPWELDTRDVEVTGLYRIHFPDNIPGLDENERKLGVAVVGSIANGHLIAAAPEMLEALRKANESLESARNKIGDLHLVGSLLLVKSAIGKAEGRDE